MKFFSVCSGIEAASVAWHKLGWECVGVSEIEKFPSAVLAHHYPKVKNFGDMTKLLDRSDFNDTAFDVLVGGTPCQSFSVAGLRKGLADPRGNLALHFLKLLDRKRPRWLVWENVPGVLSSWSDAEIHHSAQGLGELRGEAERLGGILGREFAELGAEFGAGPFEEVNQTSDFDTFTSGLRELGYNLSWRVLDAQYFGVPQRRRRVFVIGHLGAWTGPAAVLLERFSMCGHPAPSRETGEGTARPLAAGSASSGGYRNDADTADNLIPDAGPAALFNAEGSEGATLTKSNVGKHLNNQTPIVMDRASFNAGKNAQFDAKIEETETMPSLVARGPHAVLGPTEPVPILEAGARTGKSTTDPRAGIGIGKPGDPMFTLQAGKQHAIAFGSRDSGQDALEEVSPTLRAGGHAKSHPNGGVPPAVVYENHAQDSRVTECSVSPQINAKAGTGGGNLPLAITPMCFKPAHYTRGKDGAPSEVMPPLTAEADKGDTEAVIFESRFARNGRGAPEDVCPPLKAESGETGKGDAAPLVAFTQNSRSEVRIIGGDGQVTGALAAEPGAQQQNYIAQDPMILDEYNQTAADQSFPLRTAAGDGIPKLVSSAVRRLTPRECERLQGFPDDYTLIPWGQHKKDCASIVGKDTSEMTMEEFYDNDSDLPCNCGKPLKDAPDGPRYKALGNSMAVVVMWWIGFRIALVDKILRALGL